MSNPTITVTSSGVTINVGSGGGLTALSPSPAGTYAAATVTVDVYGRTTSAVANNDVAAETTQQQVLATLNAILLTTQGTYANGGIWNNIA